MTPARNQTENKTKNCFTTVTQFSSPVPYWVQGSSFSSQCYFIDASSKTLGPHLKSLFLRVVICETALLRSQMERTQFKRLCLDLKLHEMLVAIENSYNYNKNCTFTRRIYPHQSPMSNVFLSEFDAITTLLFHSPGYKGKRYLTKITNKLKLGYLKKTTPFS